MPRRRRPRTGPADSGPGSSGIVPTALPGPGRPVPDLSEMVPMALPSEGSGSTGEMPPKIADAASSGAAGTAWIQENPNKKVATASSGGVPTVHPAKGSAGTVSSVEMLNKKAAMVGGAPMVHPGKLAAGSGSGSTGDMLQKEAAVGSAPMTHPGKGLVVTSSVSSGGMPQKKTPAVAARSGSTGDMLQKKADVGSASMTHPGNGQVVTGSVSSGGMLQKKTPPVAACSGSTGDMQQKKAAVGSAPMSHPSKGQVVTSSVSSGGMLQKKTTALTGDSPALGALDGNTTTQNCEEPVAKQAHALQSAEIPQKHCTEDNADTGLSGVMLHKKISNVEADTGMSEEMLHEHITKEADTAKSIKESASNEIVHVSEKDIEIKEAEHLIKELNELRLGEPISEQEFLNYFHSLPCNPPQIDLKVWMNYEELAKQDNRHALCRLRYYQYKLQQASKEELSGDELKSILDIQEHNCDKEFLKKEGYFHRFQKDETFDWCFHPDYVRCSLLVDYQRLVLKNHGYSRWSEYHKYLHSYEIEQEYVNYCEELSKQLKWMESFTHTRRSPFKWGEISSRAARQAIKIAAASFHKISAALALNAYYEFKESIGYDANWFKEYDVVYFEIWRRVTQGMSFEKALEEVYNLNRFPLRQPMMKAALKFKETMKMMEEEFLTCMEDITPDVEEDKARELIKEAVDNRVQKPKSYEQYIRKKINIAKIIRIL